VQGHVQPSRPGLSHARVTRFVHAAYGGFNASRQRFLDASNGFAPSQMKDSHRNSPRSRKHVGKVPGELAVRTVVHCDKQALDIGDESRRLERFALKADALVATQRQPRDCIASPIRRPTRSSRTICARKSASDGACIRVLRGERAVFSESSAPGSERHRENASQRA
jgi:hypothetical protein